MVLSAQQRLENLPRVVHRMIEVDHLNGVPETALAHLLESFGPINEEHHVAGSPHTPS